MKQLLITTATTLIIFSSCTNLVPKPGTTVQYLKESQKGTKKAYAFSRAATDTSNQSLNVSMLPFDSDITASEVGDVFIATVKDTATKLSAANIDLNWLSPDSLELSYDGSLNVVKQEKVVDDVQVVFKVK